MKAYKGFNKDMTCRGFQYKEGETYETDKAELCSSGFHACEAPLDCFGYYAPADSEYHEVDLEDVSSEREEDDTKVCAKKIKVGAKLSIAKLCELQFEYVKSHCTTENNAESGKLATAGEYGTATAGYRGAATAGYRGAATAGDRGAATAGDRGVATAGYGGAATAGDCGAATAGMCSVATAGDRGVATAGDCGAATAGYGGAATAGYRGAATAGMCGVATSRGAVSVGEYGVGTVRGNNCRAKGSIGSVIVIVEEMDDNYDIYEWKAGVIDGVNLKPNTWYKLKNGEFVECED